MRYKIEFQYKPTNSPRPLEFVSPKASRRSLLVHPTDHSQLVNMIELGDIASDHFLFLAFAERVDPSLDELMRTWPRGVGMWII